MQTNALSHYNRFLSLDISSSETSAYLPPAIRKIPSIPSIPEATSTRILSLAAYTLAVADRINRNPAKF
jgi:hypothetical protein